MPDDWQVVDFHVYMCCFLIKVGGKAEENVTKDESTDESKKNQ